MPFISFLFTAGLQTGKHCHTSSTCTENWNIVAYLLKARSVKPAEKAVAREQLSKHTHCCKAMTR
jgi:hypothetical protein